MNRTVDYRNRLSSCFHVLLLSMLLISLSTAQITVPQSGFSNLLTAGKSFYYNISDSAPRPVNISKRGGPNVYDFNAYSFQRTGISRVYGVGGIPTLAARFPAQAITFGSAPDSIENSPVFLYSADTLFVIGDVSLVTQRRFKHIRPYEPMAIFPVTYPSSRTYSHTHYDTTYNASGSVAATNVYSGSDSITVDGFGTLKILGRQFECLRVKSNHYTFSDKEFMYMTREGVFLDIMMASSQRDTGLVQPMSVMVLMPSSVVSVEEQVHIPTDYTLDQNYPNPFNPSTAISYHLPAEASAKAGVSAVSCVNLRVFDILGRQVSTLVSGLRPAGAHVVQWDGNNERGERMPSGIYLYRLTVGSSEVTKKMILLK